MTAHPPAFSMSVTPVKQVFTGHDASITVTDSGTVPLKVHAVVLILHGHAGGCAIQRESAVTVTPRTFTLHAGEHMITSAHFPTSTTPADYGILYEASTGGSGGIHLTGAVGSQVIVGGSSVACHPKVPVALSKGSDSLLGSFWVVLGIGLVLLALLAVLVLSIRRRARRQRPVFSAPPVDPSRWTP